jgi:hypothetical protein
LNKLFETTKLRSSQLSGLTGSAFVGTKYQVLKVGGPRLYRISIPVSALILCQTFILVKPFAGQCSLPHADGASILALPNIYQYE